MTYGGQKAGVQDVPTFQGLKLLSDNGNAATVDVPAGLPANIPVNLPSTMGTSGQFLTTDGAGNWTWASGSVGNGVAAIGLRLSTSLNITSTAYSDVNWDTVDAQSNGSVLSQNNANPNRINIGQPGYYLISYDATYTSSGAGPNGHQVLLNGTTVVPGSFAQTGDTSANYLGHTFVAYFAATGYITLQNNITSGQTELLKNMTMVVVALSASAVSDFQPNQGSGLVVNYLGGICSFNGVTYSVAGGSTSVGANITNGWVYVNTGGVVTSGATLPANAVPIVQFTSNASAITAFADKRSWINNNAIFGPAINQSPNQTSSTGTSNKFAMADHVHNISTGVPFTISSNTNVQGGAGAWAQQDHMHQLTAQAAVNDDLPQFDGSNWQSNFPETILQPSRAIMLFDDFISSATTGNLNWLNTVASSGVVAIAAPQAGHPGIVSLSTGTNAAGYSTLRLGATVPYGHILGGGAVTLEWGINVQTLGVVAQQYAFRCGLADGVGNAAPANGVYFEYANGTTGNFWVLKCRSASTETAVTSSIAVGAGWDRLTIQINDAANSVSFYVNGALAGTIATTIPTTNIGPFAAMVKSAGTTAILMLLDYFYMNQRFTTAR